MCSSGLTGGLCGAAAQFDVRRSLREGTGPGARTCADRIARSKSSSCPNQESDRRPRRRPSRRRWRPSNAIDELHRFAFELGQCERGRYAGATAYAIWRECGRHDDRRQDAWPYRRAVGHRADIARGLPGLPARTQEACLRKPLVPSILVNHAVDVGAAGREKADEHSLRSLRGAATTCRWVNPSMAAARTSSAFGSAVRGRRRAV